MINMAVLLRVPLLEGTVGFIPRLSSLTFASIE